MPQSLHIFDFLCDYKGENVDDSTSLCLTKPHQTPGKHAL